MRANCLTHLTRQQSAHQQRGTHPTIRWSHAIFKAFSGCNVLLGNQFAIGDVVAANLLFYRKSRKTNPRNNDQAKLLFSFLLLSDGRCQGAFAASLPQLPAVVEVNIRCTNSSICTHLFVFSTCSTSSSALCLESMCRNRTGRISKAPGTFPINN